MTTGISERLGIVENDVTHIKESVNRIEKALNDHVKWEEKKYDDMEKRFAPKYVEENVNALDKEIADMPDKLSKRFAGIWTEGYLKAVIFTVGGSIVVGVFISFIIK